MADPNEMTFLQHLEELRWRLIKAFIAILVFAMVAFVFKSFVFDVLIFAPKNEDFITYRFFCYMSNVIGLDDSLCLTSSFELQNITMSGQFTSHILVSGVLGFIVAFPYVFYQLWAFIMPGLSGNEKATARGAVVATSFLFLVGVSFGYFLISPLSVQFLGGYTVSEQVDNIIALNSFITTVTMTTLSGGLVFQLPVVIYFLAKLGLVTPGSLRQYRKHAIVGVLILSAIITPPDVTSQVLVTLPLMVLYELSIYIARIVVRKNKAESVAS
ncbi:MAG TPA: twin-arginine translocase subunit TatC [Cryomorphaceae bacterium]|nr:twin-arginine translocase subunit TatC [Cryomorphaceae bacterium]